MPSFIDDNNLFCLFFQFWLFGGFEVFKLSKAILLGAFSPVITSDCISASLLLKDLGRLILAYLYINKYLYDRIYFTDEIDIYFLGLFSMLNISLTYKNINIILNTYGY